MEFGLDEYYKRIKPGYSGQRAICQICKGILIGKCGEIYVNHWAHASCQNCDSWKEHETEWHRNWKSKFPEDWREVVIELFEEKHIADIRTKNGMVVEFQNSSISTSTIRVRENFYGDMIWVINAETFKDNFNVRSDVNTRLRTIETNAESESFQIEKEYNAALEKINENVAKEEKNLNELENRLQHKKNLLKNTLELKENFTDFASSTIEKWMRDEFIWHNNASIITNKIEHESKTKFKTIQEQLRHLHSKINELEKNLSYIQSLKSFDIDGIQFKIVAYNEISSKNYFKVRAILKSSLNTFFPTIITFKNEADFLRLAYKQSEYDFVVDPLDAIQKILKNVEENKNSVESTEHSLEDLKANVTNALWKKLLSTIEEFEKELVIIEEEYTHSSSSLELLKLQQSRKQLQLKTELLTAQKDIEYKKIRERSQAMAANKSQYTFYWKHERMTWRAATAQVFFDIGMDYLFERIDYNSFKKVSIEKFLQTIN